MTVANIPIWSPATLSIPALFNFSPRKRFPPPITIPISAPISLQDLTEAAISFRIFGSIPCSSFPATDSPLNFTSTLLCFNSDMFYFNCSATSSAKSLTSTSIPSPTLNLEKDTILAS